MDDARRCEPGDVVKLGAARTGVRAYIAFAGGIDVPLVLGSRSTYLRGRLGGLQGRALRKGDVLALFAGAAAAARRVPPSARSRTATGEPEIRVVLGPQDDRFTAEGIAGVARAGPTRCCRSRIGWARACAGRGSRTRAGTTSSRTGSRSGASRCPATGSRSCSWSTGSRPGGYTKVATVCSFDIGRARPGEARSARALPGDRRGRGASAACASATRRAGRALSEERRIA